MNNYRTIRNEERKAATYHLMTCMMSVCDDTSLDLLGIPASLRADINAIRANEDDFAGCAAASFAFNISNSDLTEQDRLVVSQILAVAASAVALKKVVTKSMLDGKDVLKNKSILTNLIDWCSEASAPQALVGDAILEQGQSLLEYVEQYNSAVLDKSQQWFKGGGKMEDETASEPHWFNWIPFTED